MDSEYQEIIEAVRNDKSLDIEIIEIPADGGNSGYEEFLLTGDSNVPIYSINDEDFPISLNYTSGTTGNPKGVVYSHPWGNIECCWKRTVVRDGIVKRLPLDFTIISLQWLDSRLGNGDRWWDASVLKKG